MNSPRRPAELRGPCQRVVRNVSAACGGEIRDGSGFSPGRLPSFLLAAAGGITDAEMPRAARPRLGGISFLHRFGSALNHHVHLHACVTDGVFLPAAADAGCDSPPAFLPARPITEADLATPTGAGASRRDPVTAASPASVIEA